MKKQCETGFMNAVDIADHLARTLELPFRECYHLLSRAVKLSEPETKITSVALQKTLVEFGHPTEIAEDLEQFHNPRKLIGQRQHQGSPSPEQTSLQIAELSEELKSLSAPLEELQKRILKTHESCQNYAV
jgi:argininosuccinate lyase